MGFFNHNSGSGRDHEFTPGKMLFGIIAVSVLFFILVSTPKSRLGEMLCLMPSAVTDLQLWRLFSSLLVCTSGWELFFQMFALYIFGNIICTRINASHTLFLYLFSGLAGNLLWLAFFWNAPALAYGPGGAVNGIIMASAMALPELQMQLLFIPFPVKLRTMAIVFIVLNVLLSGLSPFSLLDIGGFLGGYLYMKLFLKKILLWDPLDFKKNFVRQGRPGPSSGSFTVNNPQYQSRETKVSMDRNEVDRILDKLSREGINALTEEEIKVLEKVREQMNKNK